MKIDFVANNLVDFDTISLGEVFSYEGSYLMRMEDIGDDYGDIYNAVDLTSGETYCVSLRDKVHPIKCKLVRDESEG